MAYRKDCTEAFSIRIFIICNVICDAKRDGWRQS